MPTINETTPAPEPIVEAEYVRPTIPDTLICTHCHRCYYETGLDFSVSTSGTAWGNGYFTSYGIDTETNDSEDEWNDEINWKCGNCEEDIDNLRALETMNNSLHSMCSELNIDTNHLGRDSYPNMRPINKGFIYRIDEDLSDDEEPQYFFNPMIIPKIVERMETSGFYELGVNFQHPRYQEMIQIYNTRVEQREREAAAALEEQTRVEAIMAQQGAVANSEQYIMNGHDEATFNAVRIDTNLFRATAPSIERDPINSPVVTQRNHRRWQDTNMHGIIECTNPKCLYNFEFDPNYDVVMCPSCKTEININHNET